MLTSSASCRIRNGINRIPAETGKLSSAGRRRSASVPPAVRKNTEKMSRSFSGVPVFFHGDRISRLRQKKLKKFFPRNPDSILYCEQNHRIEKNKKSIVFFGTFVILHGQKQYSGRYSDKYHLLYSLLCCSPVPTPLGTGHLFFRSSGFSGIRWEKRRGRQGNLQRRGRPERAVLRQEQAPRLRWRARRRWPF